MTDIKTPEQRSRNMAAIRSSDTKPGNACTPLSAQYGLALWAT